MDVIMLIFHAVLFYLLTPGVLVRLPPGSSPMVVNMTHALVFAVVLALSSKWVWKVTH